MKTWIDRATGVLAPRWTLKRLRARVAGELLLRNYDGAGTGRRQQGWRRSTADANTSAGPAIGMLRQNARDLVRNNPYAESALSTIADHAVGWGIEAKPRPVNARVKALWDAWASTTACDADGVHDFAGLQKLVTRTVARDGEALVRRRLRLPTDGLPIAMQLQVLEPDFIDTLKENPKLPNGGRIISGIELDPLGRKAAYWLFPEHPGSAPAIALQSVRVPAENIQHVYRIDRPGQLRGVSWFAPVMLRFKDLDEFEDATLMKQKIAACLAVITSDVDGTGAPLGTAEGADGQIDSLEPGMIMNVPPGRTVEVVQPPSVREYNDYTKAAMRGIATGMRVTYEDMTGDYTDVNFSSARMSRLRHWASVDDWRWRMLIPQFCNPVWNWAMQAAAIGTAGQPGIAEIPIAHWTPQPMPMIEPDKEGLAYLRNIRSGLITQFEAIRERGYDPEEFLAEYAASNKRLDELGIILDSDARRMTQQGLAQASHATGEDTKIDTEKTDEDDARAVKLRLAGARR